MKILRRGTIEVVTHYHRDFDWPGMPGCGLGFDCDEHGNVNVDALQPAGRANYEAALTGFVDGEPIVDKGVRSWKSTQREPSVGQCNHCRREVILDGFTNTCECGIDYNSAGQELAPRSQWGEETGETAADILMGGDAWEDWG